MNEELRCHPCPEQLTGQWRSLVSAKIGLCLSIRLGMWRAQCFEKANENEPHRPIATGMEFNCMLPLLCSESPSQLKPHFSPTALSQRQGCRRTGSTSSGSQQTPLSAEDPTALPGLPEMAGQSSCFHPTSLCPSLAVRLSSALLIFLTLSPLFLTLVCPQVKPWCIQSCVGICPSEGLD